MCVCVCVRSEVLHPPQKKDGRLDPPLVRDIINRVFYVVRFDRVGDPTVFSEGIIRVVRLSVPPVLDFFIPNLYRQVEESNGIIVFRNFNGELNAVIHCVKYVQNFIHKRGSLDRTQKDIINVHLIDYRRKSMVIFKGFEGNSFYVVHDDDSEGRRKMPKRIGTKSITKVLLWNN